MEHVIWVEKYRPQTIEECILPLRIKKSFFEYIQGDEITSNLLLSGPPGTGKTTIAKAAMNELNADYIFINASLNGNIDTLRYQVQEFAAKVSLTGKRKYIIWDEAERMSTAAQDAIRAFIEEFSLTCGFIFTCNNKNLIHPAIISRTANIDFNITKEERGPLLASFFKRVLQILKEEGADYDKEAVANYISSKKNSIDFRNMIIHLQHVSKIGKITAENIMSKTDDRFLALVENMKKKDFNKVRRWVIDNPEFGEQNLYRLFYDNLENVLNDKASMAALILLIAKYQFQNESVADKEINTAAFLVECMLEIKWP